MRLPWEGAALTLPRRGDEPLDVFARRVLEDMGERVEKAADIVDGCWTGKEEPPMHTDSEPRVSAGGAKKNLE